MSYPKGHCENQYQVVGARDTIPTGEEARIITNKSKQVVMAAEGWAAKGLQLVGAWMPAIETE